MRLLLILIHSSFAVLCLVLRPFLFEIVHGYAGMLAVMPTRYWGLSGALVAIGLLLSASRPGLQLFVQLASGMLLTMISIAVSTAIGPNLSTVAYLVFGLMSLWAFYRVFSIWLYARPWFQSLQGRVHHRG